VTTQRSTRVVPQWTHSRRRGVKGRALLVFRLARQDLRHHAAQAVLLVVAIAAVTATLTLAFALNSVNSAENGVTANPYQQTMAATRGPDVLAQSSPETNGTTPGDIAALVALNHAKGVAAHSGPYPMAMAEMRTTGIDTEANVEGRQPGVAAVDQPLVTAGRWVRPGGVVVERSFAEEANLRLGQMITLNGRSFRVVGFAVTAAFAGPSGINLMWATERAARSLATTEDPLTYYSNLRLFDASPGAIDAFVNANITNSESSPYLISWTVAASQDTGFLRSDQGLLLTGATLLGLLALATVAVLVGGRLTERTRRVGLLKAVGGTPDMVAATFLAENLFLALVGACVGLLAGWRVAPLLSSPGGALIGSSGTPPLTLVAVGVAVGVAFTVTLASTLVPAIRAARTSTVSALADAARLPKRRESLIRLSEKMPVPVLFGLRLVARRPRRAVLSAASIAVAVMGLVAALAIHAGVQRKFAHIGGGLVSSSISRAEPVLTFITVSLLALAAVTATFTALATVLDARRPSAVSLALGATPQQVRGGLAMTQVIPALPGAVLGLPLGLVLFKVAAHGLSGFPPVLWLIVVVLGTVVFVGTLTSVTARIALRQPVAEMLQVEAT
jgi:putative ABC transport system permease protein